PVGRAARGPRGPGRPGRGRGAALRAGDPVHRADHDRGSGVPRRHLPGRDRGDGLGVARQPRRRIRAGHVRHHRRPRGADPHLRRRHPLLRGRQPGQGRAPGGAGLPGAHVRAHRARRRAELRDDHRDLRARRPPGALRPRLELYSSILVILSLRLGPRGTATSTVSPRLWPMSALPTGDSLESLASEGFASAEPTIEYFTDLPVFSSLTCTVVPTRTWSVLRSLVLMTEAERSFSSSWAIRASSMACSFLASSYSEFSMMSPNSRASLMRLATSRRLGPESSSSSVLSFLSPSG